jgi:hypothetical protein
MGPDGLLLFMLFLLVYLILRGLPTCAAMQ